MLTEATWRISEHEATHCVLAWMLGLRVDRCTRFKSSRGETVTSFWPWDPRPIREIAFARATMTIGAVLNDVLRGNELVNGDEDVRHASKYAERAGSTVSAASDHARDLIESHAFRVAFPMVVDAMIEQPDLSEEDVARILG